MLSHGSCVVIGCVLLALVAAPAAEARRRKRSRGSRGLRSVPAKVEAGEALRCADA